MSNIPPDGMPASNTEVMEMLRRMKPAQIDHEVEPEIPMPPTVAEEDPYNSVLSDVNLPPAPAQETVNPLVEAAQDHFALEARPDSKMLQNLILPRPETEKMIRERYKHSSLKVVPMPTEIRDGKMQCYIVRSLNSAEWESAEEAAKKISASKPNKSIERILAEQVVSRSLVWPGFDQTHFVALKAGLIPTLYAITEQISLFFEPSRLMPMVYSF